MRFLATLLLCLAVPTYVEAKPVQVPVTAFAGDRYSFRLSQMADDVTRTLRCPAPLARECRPPRKSKRWKKHHRHERVSVAVRSDAVIVPLPRVRPAGAPGPDEEAATTNAVWERIAVALRGNEPVIPQVRTLNLFEGFAREIARALPGRPLKGVVGPLATKAQELVDRCGSRVISAVRHTYVAGTRRISLHASGRAVDMAGNPGCMYALLRKWPGGVSTDYGRVRHIHISYAPPTRHARGREWGIRFAHRGSVKHTRYARRHHRQQYASAR